MLKYQNKLNNCTPKISKIFIISYKYVYAGCGAG